MRKVSFPFHHSVLIFTALFSSCGHAPKIRDAPIASLNGENYQAPFTKDGARIGPNSSGITHTVITGELVIYRGLTIPEPLKYQVMRLMDGDKEIAQTQSDAGGAFRFAGDFPNGIYRIVLESTKYNANEKVRITKYTLDGIQVIASEEKGR